MNEQEKEILLIAAEECAEVTQEIIKSLRFGLDSEWNNSINRKRLAIEVGDLLCMFDLMCERGIINNDMVYDASVNKREKLKIWSNIFA